MKIKNVRSRLLTGLVAAFAACCIAGKTLADEDNWTNLYDAVTQAGQTLTVSTSDLHLGDQCGNADCLFNGIIYSAVASTCQRVLFKKPASGYPHATVTLPGSSAFAPDKRVVLRRVDLYPVTYYGNAKNRMPTEYRVYGIDDDSQKVELLHAAGLDYPNLGTNANSNEFYSVEVTEAAKSERGFRTFEIEIIDTPVMASAAVGGFVASFMEIGLQVELLDEDTLWEELYGECNLTRDLRDAGLWSSREEWTYGQNYNGGYYHCNAFDGVTHTTVDSQRWLGYIHNANGCYCEMRIPNTYAPDDRFCLSAYRLWCLSNSGNEIRRAPTSCQVLGLQDGTSSAWTAADDTGWTELAALSGLDWSGVAFSTEGMNTLGKHAPTSCSDGYRAFRFRPLTTTATAEGETGIDFGMNEVEFFGRFVNPKGTLRVRASVKGCDFGACPADGATISESATVTAPEYVQDGLTAYRVTGYRPEQFDYATGEWVTGTAVASRSYEYVKDADKSNRIVWQLSKVGVVVTVAREDGGNETVTVSPVKDFYDAEDEVTLTACPNTDVLEEAAGATNKFRSAFVRWDGDTDGIDDVASPTITVTVGTGRRLVPVFRRDWLVYEYDRANEGGSGKEWRMRDGNFEMRCNESPCNGTLAGAAGWLLSGFGSFDLDTKIVRADTGAQVTIQTLALAQLGSNAARRSDFSRVVLPKTLQKSLNASFRDQTNLVEAVIDCPELVKLAANVFTRDTALTRLVFKAPKLTELPNDYTFYIAPLDETDASEWQLDALAEFKKVGNECRFAIGELGGTHGFCGTLSLPAAVRIGFGDFGYQAHMTNAVLGAKKGTLAYIGTNAFLNCSALASMTIGSTASLFVGHNAFLGCSGLTDITFLKHIPQADALDEMLVGRSADSRANIYVSPRRPRWDGFLQPIGAEDPNPPEGAVGVYRTAAGERKAWIFYKRSPLDPKGTRIMIW